GLKEASQKAVGEQLGLSWDEIVGLMERAVKRGLQRREAESVTKIGVDEKAFRKGHSYFTLVNDLVRGRVMYVAEGRQQSSLDGFWEALTEEQKQSIAAVAMDMWDPYILSVREHVPGADRKIVFDKFHIAKHLGEAVDRVRRHEQKTLKAAGDDRLTGTRYDWLRHPAALEAKDRREFALLRNSGLKTARAWALKETAMAMFEYIYERPARKHFRWWHNWPVRSRLKPMIEVGRMLERREENYAKALAEIVRKQHQVPLAAYWGPGTTSSSDGQAFPIATRRPVLAHTNAKYGRDPVVMFYSYISDRYAPFYTKVIGSTVRDATFVLDGLLEHGTDIRIEEHYTDTGGVTE